MELNWLILILVFIFLIIIGYGVAHVIKIALKHNKFLWSLLITYFVMLVFNIYRMYGNENIGFDGISYLIMVIMITAFAIGHIIFMLMIRNRNGK